MDDEKSRKTMKRKRTSVAQMAKNAKQRRRKMIKQQRLNESDEARKERLDRNRRMQQMYRERETEDQRSLRRESDKRAHQVFRARQFGNTTTPKVQFRGRQKRSPAEQFIQEPSSVQMRNESIDAHKVGWISTSAILVKNTDVHCQKLSYGMWDLFRAGQFVDTEIHYGDLTVKVHAVVLVVFSPILRSYLMTANDSGEAANPHSIMLDDVMDNASDLYLLLEFMYRGEVVMPEERMESMQYVAKILQIASLVEAIETARHTLMNNGQSDCSDGTMDGQVSNLEQITIKIEPVDFDSS